MFYDFQKRTKFNAANLLADDHVVQIFLVYCWKFYTKFSYYHLATIFTWYL